MSDDAPAAGKTRLTRMLGEGIVIVISILAALAINTWWEGIEQHGRAKAEVASLRAEFDGVDKELARASDELKVSLDATHRLAQLAGPQPVKISADTFANLLTQSLTINARQLPTGALANLISSGDLPLLDDLELQNALASWSSVATLMAENFATLVNDRDQRVLPVVNRLMPISTLIGKVYPVWTDSTVFPSDPSRVLASSDFENAMAERYMSTWLAQITVADARERSATLRAKLNAWR